jgi:hypothetical protein
MQIVCPFITIQFKNGQPVIEWQAHWELNVW